ncbi:Nucleotide-binding universal stress protein, UspA family [Marivirga sericea]|uniref:Nucleotide-binding universal stress protein, UspA family n=1 Tax=Marivirga sericea TaxID=1028 RepID=A0A1X7I5D4_9BACT|nr:universal stress protein [Marivirga sericea]SMG09670.1 Nucleotide-binding universal stress protein, UspA family [Marivirga sericea]
MDKFLCPIDFSAYSLNAVEYAAKILQIRKGSMTLIHIFSEKEFLHAVEGEQSEFDDLKQHAKEKLTGLADEIENEYGFECDFVLSIGEVNNSISQYALKNGFDLIVMGTQGNGYNRKTIIGSRTLRTVQNASIPVLTVPLDADFKNWNSVVYASDYSEQDKITMQKLVSFIYPFRSRIRFVHVSHSNNVMSEKSYEKFKTELSSFLGYEKISYYLKEYKKDISSGIEEFVNEQQGDVLVLLKRKRNIFEKLIGSSVSTEITYLSTHALLIYHEKE